MMSLQLGANLLYPMATLVLITFAVLIMLFRARTRSVVNGMVSPAYFKTYQGADEPNESIQLARHFSNLFETPVLFYVVCLATIALGRESAPLVVLAWVFVAIRGWHAIVHIGENRLRIRIRAYFSGWIVLLCMWALLIVDVWRFPSG